MKTATVVVLLALITMEMDMACAQRYSPRGLQKPGACPKTPTAGVGPCLELCSGDDSCHGKMKCCNNGCGHICAVPVFEVSIAPCLPSPLL
ncbi:hypothetical protein ACRRTK_007300 [Alexandromys fortis]